MHQYLQLVREVLANGQVVKTRNGERLTKYGAHLEFEMRQGFPMITTAKKNYWNIAGELCWFLSGETNTKKLKEWNIGIWDGNADADGNVGQAYGYQWRKWQGWLDQVTGSVEMAMNNPASTRNLVTAWNPAALDSVVLPPCHYSYQIHTPPDRTISLQATMRSTDLMVGLPYNISSYATLLMLYAGLTNRKPDRLIMDLGNVHIYSQHMKNTKIQIMRNPLALPSLEITGGISPNLYGLHPSQFELRNYNAHPYLKYEMIV